MGGKRHKKKQKKRKSPFFDPIEQALREYLSEMSAVRAKIVCQQGTGITMRFHRYD